MALKYGGKTISDYSAMRGPCGVGFHVPTKDEWTALSGILFTTFHLQTSSAGDVLATYLKMPMSGFRDNTNSNVGYPGSRGYYWSSTHKSYSNTFAHGIYFKSSSITVPDSGARAGGRPIRAFKDEPDIPPSTSVLLPTWSKVDFSSEAGVEGAGIYYHTTTGTFSITGDGINWITIADKNVGATTVYNNGDTLSEANCGKYFQRGNNYGFPGIGSSETITTSSTQVDASGYGPGNYYSSSTFITSTGARDSSDNKNLRGGVTGVKQNPVDIVERYYGGKLIDDYSAMRGPCPEGFHVPSDGEREGVKTIIAPFLGGRPTGIDCGTYLHIPFSGYRDYTDASIKAVDTQGYYWSRSTGYSSEYASMFVTEENVINAYMSKFLAIGACVRGFKDVYSEPDSSWTVALGNLGGAGVFWNQSKGLISLTDGTNKYTIMDKNLGATTVYNSGDSLTQSNCGYYYQRGNNYGFARAGSLSTSNTQVDASGYGPNNPYYSNVFIIGSHDWSSVKNWDLRGGATGVRQRPAKVIEVYHNTTKIWPFYPAGIYWNPSIDGGVISLSNNGIDWLTMSDKNLGATQVFHPGDTYSQANCGNFYQWGNNYGFPYSGTPSRSTTKANVSSYGPGNYYSNSTFRRVDGQGEWWTSTNFNLWGGTTGTDEARRGPCSEGRHIPRKTELAAVKALTGYGSLEGKILLPKGGIRDNYSAAVTDSGSLSAIWNSDLEMGTYSYVYNLEGTGGEAYYMPAFGCNIRPFRNEAIMPTDEWTKLL